MTSRKPSTPGELGDGAATLALPFIVVLLLLGMWLMFSAQEGDVRVTVTTEQPEASATADRSSIAPILPPADLQAMLAPHTTTGAEQAHAADVSRMGSEAVRSSAAADPASTPHLLAVEATPGGVTAAPAAGLAGSGFESRPGDTSILTPDELRALLDAGGWPPELAEQGVRVACGPAVTRTGAPAPSGESGCDPSAIGAAGEIGLFQLMPGWADDCDLNVGDLYHPAENATCALWILTVDEPANGLEPWHYWSVKP